MLIAQTTPDAIQFMGWLGSFCFFLGVVKLLVGLFDRFKGKPANELLAGESVALAQRVSKLEIDHKYSLERRQKMHEKIEAFDREIRSDVKEDLGKIYGELNELRSDVAGLKNDNVHQTRHLTNIEAKLDRHMERDTR